MVDRIGGGDAFVGAYIFASISEYILPDPLEFVVTARCLKHSIEGDYGMFSRSEVESLISGDSTERVRR